MSTAPAPVLPDLGGPNVRGIVPALLAPHGAVQPSWMPESCGRAGQVVLFVVDGLGWEQLRARAEVTPVLSSMEGGPITTVAPSTTATALTSISTGLTPGEHGLVGYRMDVGGEVLNVLRWTTRKGDARDRLSPERLQPFVPFLGHRVPFVGRLEFEGTAFTAAHLRGGVPAGYRAPSGLAVQVAALLQAGERVIHAYYDGVDRIAHEYGFGAHYDAELRAVDRIVGDLLDVLPSGAVLLVTADHGQVEVGDRIVEFSPEVLRRCRSMSGEGRFRWLHARPGAAADLLAAAREAHDDTAWVWSRDEVLEMGMFGPVVSPPVAGRLGDVAVVPFAPVSFHDPEEGGTFELVCRHGSLTSAEMLVPLLAASHRT